MSDMHPELWDPDVGTDSAFRPKPFLLVRTRDITGISGVGVVAEGCEFTDASVVLRWLGPHASTVLWDSVHDAMAIHGHHGDTRIEYL